MTDQYKKGKPDDLNAQPSEARGRRKKKVCLRLRLRRARALTRRRGGYFSLRRLDDAWTVAWSSKTVYSLHRARSGGCWRCG